MPETGPNMSEILANYMIFSAWKSTFVCAFLIQIVGYFIDNK